MEDGDAIDVFQQQTGGHAIKTWLSSQMLTEMCRDFMSVWTLFSVVDFFRNAPFAKVLHNYKESVERSMFICCLAVMFVFVRPVLCCPLVFVTDSAKVRVCEFEQPLEIWRQLSFGDGNAWKQNLWIPKDYCHLQLIFAISVYLSAAATSHLVYVQWSGPFLFLITQKHV